MIRIPRFKFHLVVALALASMLFACGGGGGSNNSSPGNNTEIVVNPGSPPTANAGAGATYNGGEIAMLDGTGSSDPDNDPLRYTWLQTAGTNTVQLSDVHAARPVFEAPNADDVLTFSLVVNDGYDNSIASSVTITTMLYTGATVTAPSGNPFRGSYSISGAFDDFVISGNYLYLPVGTSGFRVLDVTDPVNLTQVGTSTTWAYDATLVGNYLFHTSYDSTWKDAYVYATDVSNPASPALAAPLITFYSPSIPRITSAGSVLYVAGGDSETVPSLRIYQTTNDTSTFKISLPLPAAPEDVVVSGSSAYVADGASGLRIIDVSLATAATPTIKETSSFDTAGSAVDVAVSGGYAYVADSMNGLVILNVSNPASPSLVTTIPTPSGSSYGATSVDVSGDGKTLYYSNDFDVWVYDVTTPASPVALGYYRAGNLIRKVRVAASYIYVTDSQGLRSIPAAKVSMPRGAALYTAPDAIREMRVYGDLGFVRMYHRLDILDMRNAAAPTPLSSYTPQNNEYLWGMAVVDNFAYLTQGTDKLNLLRFRNPAAPDVAKTIALGANANPYYIVANDSYAYVYRNEFSTSKVEIFDVTSPYSPVARGFLASPSGNNNWLRSIAVKGNRLYLTELNTGGTFRVADVGNPAAPALLGGLGPVDLYGLAFRNDYVLSIGNNVGVKVLDVSNPAAPVFAGAGYAQPGYSISVAASRAYAGSDFVGGGVKVLDVEDPLAPKLAGELAPAGGAAFPVVAGRSLYSFFNSVELHRNEREPMLASRYVTGSRGAALAYSVSWLDEANGQDHAVTCRVTGGSCTVGAIDQAANSVTVNWTLPGSAGDNEILIAVGNGHYFGTTKDRVKAQ